MTVGNVTGGRSKNLILAAMIFAVAMTLVGLRSGVQEEAQAVAGDSGETVVT